MGALISGSETGQPWSWTMKASSFPKRARVLIYRSCSPNSDTWPFASLAGLESTLWAATPTRYWPQQYTVIQWTVDNGLPQNRISALAQTPDGYLWVGTLFGLVRFDGNRFTLFNRYSTPVLNEEAINALAAGVFITLFSSRMTAFPNGSLALARPGDSWRIDGAQWNDAGNLLSTGQPRLRKLFAWIRVTLPFRPRGSAIGFGSETCCFVRLFSPLR
jgi:hypothetical protein